MGSRTTRRHFVLASSAAAALAGTRVRVAAITVDDAWSRAADIARTVSAPVLPSRAFDITRFGARADGIKSSTAAIAQAIDACAKEGGGRVLVPAGRFLTGAIHLKSNVELHVSQGATLLFDTNPVTLGKVRVNQKQVRAP